MSAQILQHPATLKRAWESAGLSPALAGWIAAAIPPDVDIYSGLRQLRARSREAAQNSDHMKQFLRLVEVNVIGPSGINIQAKPKLASGATDAATAARIEEAYTEQSERGAWDATGQHSRSSFDRLGVRAVAQDGEVAIWIHEHDPDSPTGFSVELIDAEAIDLDYNAILTNGNIIRMGVEMTPRRRPIAYHLFRESPHLGTGYASGYGRTDRVRVPAADLLHVYLPEWVWGTRGVPWGATSLRREKMLSGYEEAAITAARAAACKNAAYEANEWAQPGTDMAGRREDDGRFTQDLEPNTAEKVPYGWSLKTLDWAWPNTEHGQFVKECVRSIAVGRGVSHAALSGDLSDVNFSSMRHGALLERDVWMTLQSWWIDWVSRPVRNRWFAYAVRTGRISRRNGLSYPLDQIQRLGAASYQGRRWPWVDPLKDIQTARESVALGVSSISQVIRESGRDPDEVWDELGNDIERLAKLGIPLDTLFATPSAQAGAPQETDPNAATND